MLFTRAHGRMDHERAIRSETEQHAPTAVNACHMASLCSILFGWVDNARSTPTKLATGVLPACCRAPPARVCLHLPCPGHVPESQVWELASSVSSSHGGPSSCSSRALSIWLESGHTRPTHLNGLRTAAGIKMDRDRLELKGHVDVHKKVVPRAPEGQTFARRSHSCVSKSATPGHSFATLISAALPRPCRMINLFGAPPSLQSGISSNNDKRRNTSVDKCHLTQLSWLGRAGSPLAPPGPCWGPGTLRLQELS